MHFGHLALAGALLVVACATAPKPHSAPLQTGVLITLQESCEPIMICPNYNIELTPSGHYRYEGIRDVEPIGVQEGELGPAAWTNAEAAFTAADWETLPDMLGGERRRACRPDSPHAVITRREASGTQTTLDYNLSCDFSVANHLLTALRAAIPRPGSK